MLFARRQIAAQLSDLRQRVQRLEKKNTEIRAHIEGEAAQRITAAQMSAAAQAGLLIGSAVETFAATLRVPLKRGRAGWLAPARYHSLTRDGRTGASWPTRTGSKSTVKSRMQSICDMRLAASRARRRQVGLLTAPSRLRALSQRRLSLPRLPLLLYATTDLRHAAALGERNRKRISNEKIGISIKRGRLS